MNMQQYEFKPPVYSVDTTVFNDHLAAESVERQLKTRDNIVMTNIVRTNDNGYMVKYYVYASGWHTF